MRALPSDAQLDAYCLELGRIALLWGQIDILLDFCNSLLLKNYGGPKTKQKLPRIGLKDKIRFFRDSCKAGIPDPTKSEGVKIADQVEALSDARHWLIHGAADLMDTSGMIRLTKAKLKGVAQMEDKQTSLEDIRSFQRKTADTGLRLNTFLQTGLLRLSGDQINQMLSQSLSPTEGSPNG